MKIKIEKKNIHAAIKMLADQIQMYVKTDKERALDWLKILEDFLSELRARLEGPKA